MCGVVLLKKLFINYGLLLYMEIIYGLFTYDSYQRVSIFNVILFTFIEAIIVTGITNLFNKKVNKIISYIVYIILALWFSLYYIFNRVFETTFTISLFALSDQALQFGSSVIISILQNSYVMVLLFVPVIVLIVFRKKIFATKLRRKSYIVCLVLLLCSIFVFWGNVMLQGRGSNSSYNLLFKVNNNALNIERFGVINASYIDLYRMINGFKEEVREVVNIDNDKDSDNDLFEYDNNVMNINFGNSDIGNYLSKETPSKKNKYTGMFKDKNLIYIVAESFSEIAVSEELTPTLYKLVNNGFVFNNYYSSNNCSTIGGEFQALTGLYADMSILPKWRSGSNTYPYSLAHTFQNMGYKTYAYHNNSYAFQDRNVYLKSQGFDNFKGCYNGMEKIMNCNTWPQSDKEMFDSTVVDYVDGDDKFLAYYVTVSGHFYYNFRENGIARKNREFVDNLPYDEEVKGYVATQIELDRALESLIKKLEDSKKLDDTVIVLMADHYPYNLKLNQINQISSYQRDSVIEVNSNNLIIYNSKMKKVLVDKVGMSIDVIPTVYNLFSVEYDSRLFMGRDILSNSIGLAFFNNRSWVSDKGVYYSNLGKFISKDGEDIPDGYVNNINSLVGNRMNMSKLIIRDNYYKNIK